MVWIFDKLDDFKNTVSINLTNLFNTLIFNILILLIIRNENNPHFVSLYSTLYVLLYLASIFKF